MHVCQTVRNVDQLNRTSVKLLWGWDQGATYKLSAVYVFIRLNELVDVPKFHPLENHCKPAFIYRHSKQW